MEGEQSCAPTSLIPKTGYVSCFNISVGAKNVWVKFKTKLGCALSHLWARGEATMTMRSIGAAALLLSAVFTSHAEATTIDLTTAGVSGTLNGAIYTQGSAVSGTGVFPSFVQIQPQTGNTTTEEAYNTTVNNVLNNGPADPHNHEVRLSAVPIVNVSGTNYYSFLLDINESSGQGHAGEQFLSLDRIQLYTSTAANLSTTTLDASGLLRGLGTLRYDG